MPTASELVAGVRDLVVLPESYLRIQTLLRDPGSGIEDFARAVHGDPALAARVLRAANSAFFGVSRRVERISLALSLMGISRLHDLVLASAVIGTFSRMSTPGIAMGPYWRRSIHVGILSRMLAEAGRIFDSERLFVAGLLHDIGHLIMDMQMPAVTGEALAHSRAQSLPLFAAERSLFGCHYGDVGAELMNNWLFPDSLQEICRLHSEPALAREFGRECAIVHIAQHAVLGAETDQATLPFLPPLAPDMLTLAGLASATVDDVFAKSLDHLAEAVDLLLPKRAA
jgi:HD-like signal output (HDOD) protein